MSGKVEKIPTAAVVAACVVLHFYTGIRTFFENWYNDYTAWSWTFLVLWLLILLALDIRFFFSEGENPLRSFKWYWGFGTGLFTAFFLMGLAGVEIPDLLAVPYVLLVLLFPETQIEAFSWLLFHECEALSRSAQSYVACGLNLLFCLLHFVYTAWLLQRMRKKGALSDGPVEPGAGTVE